MLTGEFLVTIDEKGRVMIPSKLRAAVDGSSLYVTKGLDRCLWLLLPASFEQLVKAIQPNPAAMFDRKRRAVQHLLISPASCCDIDRAGRINVPPTLRSYAGLPAKGECLLMGSGTYLELWSKEAYENLEASMADTVGDDAQDLIESLDGFGKV